MIGAVEGINNINTVKLFNASNAFKASTVKPAEQENTKEIGINIRENSILKNINVAEIKEYANSVGEINLSEDDIKYGLKYGRSVLVSYSA